MGIKSVPGRRVIITQICEWHFPVFLFPFQPLSHSFLCSSDPLKLDTQKGKKKKKVRDPGEKKMIHFENQKTTYGPHRKIAL